MKKLLSLLSVSIVLITGHTCLAQNRFSGIVVEIKDGRSFVMETPAGRINCVLQYIEVPEPEQPLHQTVIDHLGLLTIGKSAQFQAVSMTPSRLTGKLVIGGLDISVQMLRDGAAWLLPAETTGASESDFALYKQTEELAKGDHLGLWSIPNLKPAWVVRAENEERLRRQLASKPKPRARLDITSQFETITRPDRQRTTGDFAAFNKNLWLDVFAGVGSEAPGVKTYSDPKGLFNVSYTSNAFITLTDGKNTQRLECRIGYVVYPLVNRQQAAHYLIGFRALSDDYNFSRRLSRLKLTIDGHAISMSLHHGLRGKGAVGAIEMMFYQIPLGSVKQMTAAAKVSIRIDKLSGDMGKDLQNNVAELLAATM